MELTNGTLLQLGNIKGADGIGITKSEINASGHLLLTYTTGETADLGNVVGTAGADGEDGVGIKTVTLSTDGELSVTLTDNTMLPLGNVKGPKGDKGDTGARGPQGEKGDKGDTGAAGRGIQEMKINDAGDLVVYYTDGTNQNLGSIGGTDDTQDIPYLEFTLLADGTFSVSVHPNYRANIESITIPKLYNGKAVTAIKDRGFDACVSLKEIKLPDTITTIGALAFTGCSSLTEIILPNNINSIAYSAFNGCTSLAKINIPDKVTKLDADTFKNCTSLKYIFIPASIEYIHNRCFISSGLTEAVFEIKTGWTKGGIPISVDNPSQNAQLLKNDGTKPLEKN